ncbi:MAG: hypothetical protein K940chlam8_01037 [Chlamydiae bacterium]|nr:hypothetical protein [Chlamydiota bacterium]
MTAIQGFDYPSNIQFEEKEGLLVQKNEPGYFERMDTIRQRRFIVYGLMITGILVTTALAVKAVTHERINAYLGTFFILSSIAITAFVSIYFIPEQEFNFETMRHEDVKHLEDSKFREAWLKGLKENGKNIDDLLSYINQHGTDNIQKWGLRLHPDSCPLITKEIIRDFIMNEQDMSTLFRAFNKDCYSLPKEKRHSANFKEWAYEAPKFIEFVDKHAILSLEDKKEIEKKIVRFVMTAQQPSILLRNKEALVSYGFNVTPEMQQLLQLVGDCKKEMEEMTGSFKEKLEALIQELSENIQSEEKEVIADDSNPGI